MNGNELFAIVGTIVFVVLIAFERTYSFRNRILTARFCPEALYGINLIATILVVQLIPLIVAFETSSFLSMIHLTYMVVSIPPSFGFALIYTRNTIRREAIVDDNVEALSLLIAKEARKAASPKDRLSELIQSNIRNGKISQYGAQTILVTISKTYSDLSEIASDLAETLQN